MKAVLVVLLSLSVCATPITAVPPRKEPIQTEKGSMVWRPDVHEGWKIASITRLHSGKLEVFVAPDHCYQYAATQGAGYTNDIYVDQRYYEVAQASLGAGAAKHSGWRNPLTHRKYVTLEFYEFAEPKAPEERAAFVQVYTDGTNYLLLITTIRPRPLEVSLPRLADLRSAK